MSYKGILNLAFNNFSVNDRVGPLYWFGKLRKNRNSPKTSPPLGSNEFTLRKSNT